MRRPRGRGEQGRLRSGPTRGPASSHDTHPGRGRPGRVAPSGQPPRPSGASTAAARTARGGRHPALTAGQAPDAPPDAGPEAGSQLAASNSTPGREPRTLLGDPMDRYLPISISATARISRRASAASRQRGIPSRRRSPPGAPARIAPVRIVDNLRVAAGQAERQVDVPASPDGGPSTSPSATTRRKPVRQRRVSPEKPASTPLSASARVRPRAARPGRGA